MNEIELCKDIRTRLEVDLADLELIEDSAEKPLVPPQIVDGYLPPKRSDDKPDFPYVIVRPGNGGTDAEGMSTAEVKLLIGCYSEEHDGYIDCLRVLEVIRRSFMEKPTIGSVFRFQLPLQWELYDAQAYPEWALEVTTNWTIATPQQVPEEGEFNDV